MRCEQARQALGNSRYAAERSRELETHLAECQACSAFRARELVLDRWLALDDPAPIRPGFDTRFFAQLEAEKARARRQRRRRWTWVLAPVMAGAALVLLRPTPTAHVPNGSTVEVPPDDLGLAMELDLIQDLDLVRRLDEVEAYELLGQVDEGELERSAGESL